MRGKALKREQKGFTFVEVMIVCLILTGVIGGFFGVYNAGFVLNEQLKSSVIAICDGRSILENMRNIDPFDVTNLVASYPNGGFVGGYNNLPQETVQVNYENIAADPIKVTVTVTWRGAGERVHTERLVTFLTKH
ncbi:MAG: prepilin-type N-terminal cleavage/methylation domain-containing protein [Candidatus Omnitrophica bacterium]|nr:prepilin-type N-terminal cleavage/methylation domain-containing protein [Candidatus Omnitrophota bacterium]MBU4477634.1 prepilin-type N-terminal cleavage/methylation domain-containing protein [Candidatus Omnitrophota bacterium]MCG2704310.1 prepilin-type N-terminal cleavage/methylation domain-containing protein [Candidatus Omnitrophota bacterium]